MIPASSFGPIIDGKAWVVYLPNPVKRLDQWPRLDRPCDDCDGKSVNGTDDERDLWKDNCINGRHTFTVEVEGRCDPMGHCCFAGCDLLPCGCCRNAPHLAQPVRTLRVSVVPGMVEEQEDGTWRVQLQIH